MDIRAALRARIAAVDVETLGRRAGPAAASVVAHIVVGALVFAMLGAAAEPDIRVGSPQDTPLTMAFVEIELAPEPEPILRVTPEPPPELVLNPEPRVQPEPVPEPEPPPEPVQPSPPEPEVRPPPPPEPPKPQPQLEPRPEPPPPPQATPAPQPVARPEPPRPEPPRPEPPRQMASVTPPPLPSPPAPPAPQPKPAEKKPEPTKPEPGAEKIPSAPPVIAAAPSTPGDSVFLPPSVKITPGGPSGLRGLMGDPCESRFGVKPKECAGRELAALTGSMDSVMPRSKAELAQHFGEFQPKCPYKVGCEGGEWISTNGTRAPQDNTSSASGGAASLGGIHDVVGRLPPNPDFVDPGFGD